MILKAYKLEHTKNPTNMQTNYNNDAKQITIISQNKLESWYKINYNNDTKQITIILQNKL